MKVMIDTNVLISALVFGGTPKYLIERMTLDGHKLYVSEYIEQELREIFQLKWPVKADDLIKAYRKIGFACCKSTNYQIAKIRDIRDIPILSDAIMNKMDVLITGDKDFLEADIDNPLVFSPRMMLDYLEQKYK